MISRCRACWRQPFRVRHRYFGKAVQLYYLRNAKSGLCPEDCGYCSQSKLSKAPIDKYVFQDEKTLLEGARQAKESQAKTFCIVASGRGPTDRELNHVANTVRKIKDTYGLHICVCLGLLTPDQAQVLKDAGVDRGTTKPQYQRTSVQRNLYDAHLPGSSRDPESRSRSGKWNCAPGASSGWENRKTTPPNWR